MSFLQRSHFTGIEVFVSSRLERIVQTNKKLNQVKIAAISKALILAITIETASVIISYHNRNGICHHQLSQ